MPIDAPPGSRLAHRSEWPGSYAGTTDEKVFSTRSTGSNLSCCVDAIREQGWMPPTPSADCTSRRGQARLAWMAALPATSLEVVPRLWAGTPDECDTPFVPEGAEPVSSRAA